jgi:hypothetical protein
MANLDTASFPTDADGKALLAKVQAALRELTPQKKGVDKFPSPPDKLMKIMDDLRRQFANIWKDLKISFDPAEKGASISPALELKIGPFFLVGHFTQEDMQKVILHEYLHKAMSFEPPDGFPPDQRHSLEHSKIDDLLEEMGYRPPVNPAMGKI